MDFSREQLFSLIDLTSLNEADDRDAISTLCDKTISPLGHVAAVCVYPQFVAYAKNLLQHTSVNIATVVNFPSGDDSLESTVELIQQSIQHGANEIDAVFPYSQFLRGEKETAYEFIRACKAACTDSVLLKVILETGALKDVSLIAEVSYNLCHNGADFLKTSTGKIPVGATIEAARAMLEVIQKIPRPIGLKISGGVRTVEQAQQYIELASSIMGEAWVTPTHFRIGASALADVLCASVKNT